MFAGLFLVLGFGAEVEDCFYAEGGCEVRAVGWGGFVRAGAAVELVWGEGTGTC